MKKMFLLHENLYRYFLSIEITKRDLEDRIEHNSVQIRTTIYVLT